MVFNTKSSRWLQLPTSLQRSKNLLEKIERADLKLSVIGLGRVGLPLSVAFVNCGISVIGVDSNASYVSNIRNRRAPFSENRFNDLLGKALASGKLTVTTKSGEAVRASDIIIVTVGTPVTERHNVDYSQIREVLSVLVQGGLEGKALGFRSTLGPGTTEELIIPYLQESTGLKVGRDFFLAVCPERILEGKAIDELHDLPEIVGGADEASKKIFSALFKKLNPEKRIRFLSTTGAELAKLFTNVYRYTNFALANEFGIWAEMYQQDAPEIIRAANFGYPRSNIPLPGFAGGPCLAKDGLFLDNSITFSSLISAAWKLNEAMPQHVADSIKRALGRTLYSKKIGVLGVAYKAGIDDVRLSPALKLVNILTEQGALVEVHDPYVRNKTVSIDRLVRNKDCIILAVNHPEFSKYKAKISQAKPKLVYDVWGMFDRVDFKNSKYMGFGRGS